MTKRRIPTAMRHFEMSIGKMSTRHDARRDASPPSLLGNDVRTARRRSTSTMTHTTSWIFQRLSSDWLSSETWTCFYLAQQALFVQSIVSFDSLLKGFYSEKEKTARLRTSSFSLPQSAFLRRRKNGKREQEHGGEMSWLGRRKPLAVYRVVKIKEGLRPILSIDDDGESTTFPTSPRLTSFDAINVHVSLFV